MPTRSALRLAAVLAVAAAAALDAGAASAAGPAQLAGTTVIEGSTSSVMRVSLPRDVVVDGEKGFSASRNGRIQGLLLRPAGAPITDVNALLAASVNFCFTKGCTPAPDAPVWEDVGRTPTDPESTTDDYTLPKGFYDLYLIADGAPGSVTLELQGLSGRTTLRPAQPVRSQIVTDAPATPQLGVGPISFSAGSTNPVGNPAGAIFNAIVLNAHGPGAVAMGRCFRPDGAPIGPTYDACGGPGAFPHVVSHYIAPEPAPFTRVGSGWALVRPGDSWTMAGWIEGAAAMWEAAHMSLSLTYAETRDDGPGGGDDRQPPGTGPRDVTATTDPKSGTPQQPAASEGPAAPSADRTPCRPKLHARRAKKLVRLTVRSTETCVVEARLVRGRRTVATAAGVARAGRATILRLRARRQGRMKLVVVTSDAAGNRARRSLSVR